MKLFTILLSSVAAAILVASPAVAQVPLTATDVAEADALRAIYRKGSQRAIVAPQSGPLAPEGFEWYGNAVLLSLKGATVYVTCFHVGAGAGGYRSIGDDIVTVPGSTLRGQPGRAGRYREGAPVAVWSWRDEGGKLTRERVTGRPFRLTGRLEAAMANFEIPGSYGRLYDASRLRGIRSPGGLEWAQGKSGSPVHQSGQVVGIAVACFVLPDGLSVLVFEPFDPRLFE